MTRSTTSAADAAGCCPFLLSTAALISVAVAARLEPRADHGPSTHQVLTDWATDGGPFLSGATQGDLELKAPNPKDDEDVAGIINRIQFRPTKPDHLTSCPRRLEGYVDVDHPVLKFTNVDGKPSTADVMTKCGELKTKVQNVIASFRGGAFVGGTGT
ncbi:MAG: hypothetical protein KDK70_40070 [Myxococcales bacterium]|nr:hypothetical protein [Myxococcales bacterium]